MSSYWLKSIRDDVHRESAEVYEAVCSTLKAAMEDYAGKTVKLMYANAASDGTPRYRAAAAEAQYAGLHQVFDDEFSSMNQVEKCFMTTLKSIMKCDMADVTSADFSKLSEADCRRALPLLWKLFEQSKKKGLGLLPAINHAYGERRESKEKLLRRWDAEASKQCQEMDRLHAEAKMAETRVKQLTTSVKACAKRLAKLSSPPPKKARKLGALRAERNEAARKVLDLEKHLEIALANDTTLERKCEELEEKVRCPSCMDREKNATFACGHAYCEQCATEWNTCSYNCKRPDSGKPVKFRYPRFLC